MGIEEMKILCHPQMVEPRQQGVGYEQSVIPGRIFAGGREFDPLSLLPMLEGLNIPQLLKGQKLRCRANSCIEVTSDKSGNAAALHPRQDGLQELAVAGPCVLVIGKPYMTKMRISACPTRRWASSSLDDCCAATGSGAKALRTGRFESNAAPAA